MSKQLDEAARLLVEAEKVVSDFVDGNFSAPEKTFNAYVTLADLNIRAANIAQGETA